ncbi:MAG: hypothetical protein JW938_01120, partial [Candidatus Omnitrophica bacterium]|nr:hypothetical protein [Candidatus Omnitrophota bacterium]
PRLKEARFLTMHAKPRAMIDVSDGLAQDLGHMLDASKCGAMLYEVQLPISSELKKHYTKHSTQIQHVLGDGEDYELLFTMSRAKAERLYAYIEKHKVKTRFTVIGKIIREKGIRLERVDGSVQRVLVRGYEHFK